MLQTHNKKTDAKKEKRNETTGAPAVADAPDVVLWRKRLEDGDGERNSLQLGEHARIISFGLVYKTHILNCSFGQAVCCTGQSKTHKSEEGWLRTEGLPSRMKSLAEKSLEYLVHSTAGVSSDE